MLIGGAESVCNPPVLALVTPDEYCDASESRLATDREEGRFWAISETFLCAMSCQHPEVWWSDKQILVVSSIDCRLSTAFELCKKSGI